MDYDSNLFNYDFDIKNHVFKNFQITQDKIFEYSRAKT